MGGHQISEAARRFLIEGIGSLERLDILLQMQHQAERWWSAVALAHELRLPVPQIEAGLHALGASNLVAVQIAVDVLYRFDPGTAVLCQLVEEIVSAHYADRGNVATVISSGTADSVRLFADAFRLRKGAEDG
jgi:signal transduction histidine kinase